MTIYSATVEAEDHDEDICLGDYDGVRTVTLWVVNFYVDGERLRAERCCTEEARARYLADTFTTGGFLPE